MFKKIMVPLDGSELAEAALPVVEGLATCLGSEVILVQVVPSPRGRSAAKFRPFSADLPVAVPRAREDVEMARHPIYKDQEMISLKAKAKVSLARAEKRLRDQGIQVKVDVLFGRPAEEIIAYAEQAGVDVILLSTHGESGLGPWNMGATAERVLRGANVPVLLVRPAQARVRRGDWPGSL
ncbi:MAG: universal stress protein [Chloroflexota bacterium]